MKKKLASLVIAALIAGLLPINSAVALTTGEKISEQPLQQSAVPVPTNANAPTTKTVRPQVLIETEPVHNDSIPTFDNTEKFDFLLSTIIIKPNPKNEWHDSGVLTITFPSTIEPIVDISSSKSIISTKNPDNPNSLIFKKNQIAAIKSNDLFSTEGLFLKIKCKATIPNGFTGDIIATITDPNGIDSSEVLLGAVRRVTVGQSYAMQKVVFTIGAKEYKVGDAATLSSAAKFTPLASIPAQLTGPTSLTGDGYTLSITPSSSGALSLGGSGNLSFSGNLGGLSDGTLTNQNAGQAILTKAAINPMTTYPSTTAVRVPETAGAAQLAGTLPGTAGAAQLAGTLPDGRSYVPLSELGALLNNSGPWNAGTQTGTFTQETGSEQAGTTKTQPPNSAASPASPASLAHANTLNLLGLYQGVSTHAFTPALGDKLNRQTAAVQIVRLFDIENTASTMSEADARATLNQFSDADKVAPWALKAMAYAVEHNLIAGYPDKRLAPQEALTGNAYSTMLLKGIGTSNIIYANALQDMVALTGQPFPNAAEMANRHLIRGNLVDLSFSALSAYTKTGRTLLSDLIAKGAIKENAVVQSKLMPEAHAVSGTAVAVHVNFAALQRIQRGETLNLPATMHVIFSDTHSADMPVTWNPFDTSTVGSKTLEGTIQGTSFSVSIPIEVYAPVVRSGSSSSSNIQPETPATSAPIIDLVDNIKATDIHTLVVTMKSGKLLTSIATSKIKFRETDSNGSPEIPALVVTGIIIAQDKLSATLTLDHAISEDVKYDGEDFDSNPTRLRTYFDEGALQLTNGSTSLALATTDALPVQDKIAPTLKYITKKTDMATNTPTLVLVFKEPVFDNSGASATNLVVKDITTGTTLIATTDYTILPGTDYGTLEIHINKSSMTPDYFSVALQDGSNISDGVGPFNASANHPAPFEGHSIEDV